MFSVLALSANNFYWYRTSEGSSGEISVFRPSDSGGGSGENPPWNPGGSWNPGGEWVLFATSGKMTIKKDSTIKGNGGFFGSNSTPQNKNDLSSFGWEGSISPVENYYIGNGQNSKEVIDIFSNPDIQSDFYDYWVNDKFGKLPQKVTFSDPSENFPLKDEHFTPGLELEYKDHPDNYPVTISSNIHYAELNTTNHGDQKVILELGSDDLVVQIDNLHVGDNTKFEIQLTENAANAGRVFLFVENCNEFDYTIIGDESYSDKTFFFYSGNNDLSLSGDSRLYGSVYLKNSGFSIKGGSGGIKDLVSKAGLEKNIILNSDTGTERLLRNIYAKYSSIKVENDGPITGGFVTGGETVYIDEGSANSTNPDYIYAPNAHITFKYDNTFTGSYIGDSITVDAWSIKIQGPPHGEIEKPVIPRPNPPIGMPFPWNILTKTGYDLGNNVTVNGHIVVYQTETVNVKNHTEINGDIIVHKDGLMNGVTLEDLNDHNGDSFSAYQEDFSLPICSCTPSGTYDGSTVHINANAVINEDICAPNADTIRINGNATINGNIISNTANLVRINGGATINGGICAPNATLRINGQANVSNKIYVNFIEMNNGTLGFSE